MKKKSKRLLAQFMCCLLLIASVAPAQAAQFQPEITPQFTELASCSVSAQITGTNELNTVSVCVVNDLQTVTRVVVRTYVEKRSLLVIWNRVDIGETNNEWVDSSGDEYFRASHTVQLPSSGTYRVTSVFEVYGGSVLIETVERTETVSC